MTKTLTIPTKLEDAIKNNSLVIFVGAGCSMPLGMPSWKTLVEEILQDLHNKYGETSDTHFQNILNGVKANTKTLFDALNKVENDPDNGAVFKIKTQEFINSQIEEISKKLPDESKVHDLLWKISSKIITTNYDKILEKYIPKSISPKIFDNSNAFQSLKSQSNNSEFLYKIHGDYEDPKSIILFESDYRDIYKNENYNADTLATHFKEKTLLFIGFSLTDPFVNDLFLKIKDIYSGYSINEHFIFTTKNEDFIKYGVTPIKIENWKDDLLNYLLELKKIKSEVNQKEKTLPTVFEKVTDKELTNVDISNIIELVNKKTKDLLNNPGNKDLIKEYRDLRGKLNKLLYGKIDYLQEVDKPFRESDLQNLFETIYSTETLNKHTLEQIQKVRNDIDKYKWYDRSVIVSAICCSLIHFNKANEQKINLLIDFINDNEDKVWQKAITSLFVVLNHLGNKWLRLNAIKNKIKSLNENSRIQNACSSIIKLFNIGLNKVSMIDEELFNNPYFSDSPFNYFLPYHKEENPAFDIVYETFDGDVEKFINILDQVPIPDQLKYLFCNTKDEVSNEEKENSTETLEKILEYNSIFYPYSIHVQELISFYKYFPVFKHEEKLKSQLKLTETPLKDYLLDAKHKYSALGSHFMFQENWSQAIVNYKESLKFDMDVSNLLNLANCYLYNKDFNEEFNTRIRIQKIDPTNEYNLEALFNLYFGTKKDFNSSLDIAQQLITINNINPDYYNYGGISSKELKKYNEALNYYNKAIEIKNDSTSFYNNRANLYSAMDDYDNSLLDWNTAIDIDPLNDNLYYGRALIYSKQRRYIDSNKDLTKAISINNKDYEYLLRKAHNNLFLLLFDDALNDIEKAKALNIDKESVYHFYSSYYRLKKDFERALEFIKKAEDIRKNHSFTGTKATIYASMGDLDNFYKYLEEAFIEEANANQLYPDIKDQFKNEPQFIALLKKYNQKIY